jgi:hypothetical protein
MQIIAKNLRYNLLLRAVLNIIVALRGVATQARRLVFVRRSLGCAARLGAPLAWVRRSLGCAARLGAPLAWVRRSHGKHVTASLFLTFWQSRKVG